MFFFNWQWPPAVPGSAAGPGPSQTQAGFTVLARLKTVPSPVGLSGIIILTRPRCHRAGSRVRGGSVAATELQLEVDHRLIRVIGLG